MRWFSYPRLTTRFVIGKKNVAAIEADREFYNSAWNAVERCVGTRSVDLSNEIEHHYQSGVTDALKQLHPCATPALADAKAMLHASLAI